MKIPTNVIIIWPGTHASIPSGFSRVTELDAKYPKGASSGNSGNGTGGATTHTHTSPVHSHTLQDHAHSGSLSTVGRTGDNTNNTSDAQILNNDHNHTYNISGTSGGTTGTTAVTYGSASNDPPYYEVIYIKSNGFNNVPTNAIYFWDGGTAPAGDVFCDGTSGSPDLRGKYLKGAATSGNAGGTGGSTTNTHDISHTHTTTGHTHTGTSSNTIPDTAKDRQYSAAQTCVWHSHTHTVTLTSDVQPINSYSGSLVTTETVEPVYKKLSPIQNQGGADAVIGGIAMWLGSPTQLPPGWNLYTAMYDNHLKCSTTLSEAGNTGGSNTHTHAAQSHSHTSNGSHTHPGGTVSPHTGADDRIGNGTPVASPSNNHTITSISSTTASYDSANTTADSSSNEPAYTTVVFIQHQYDGQTNYAVGNVLRRNDTAANSAKASIVRTESGSSSAKANIGGVKDSYVRANIRQDTFLKRYLYRIYDGTTGEFTASWANEITTQPSFRTVINGGSGELLVRMNRPFDSFGEDDDVKINNRIEVWVSDREQTNGILLYSGYISGYRPVLQGSKEFIEITCLPYIAELQRFLLRDGSGNTTIAFSSQDPSVILKAIVDYARADGCHINYTPSSVDLTGTTVSYTFNTSTCREALNKVIELCPEGWYWYVDPNNTIHLHAKSETATHSFRIGKNISALETWRRVEDLVNRVYFTGGGGLYRKYENTGSITSYGLYSAKYVDQRVTVAATASTIANRIINTKKDPEIRTKIKITDSNGINGSFGYDIETVKVGDTMRIFGLKEGSRTISYWDQMEWDVDVWDQTLSSSAADVIQILSVTYSPNFIEIEASSRLPEVQKRIEDINRNLEDSQTVDNPTAPS